MNFSLMIADQLLEHQTECPKCNVSWIELEDSLHQVGENYDTARIIIDNCKICAIRFRKEVENGVSD